MARYPGAEWRPLSDDWSRQPRMVRYDLVILHTMAGSLTGTDGWFRRDGYGGSESHFGVGTDKVFQWQDTMYRAEANGTANTRAISIETADMGPGFPKWDTSDGSAVPAWTDWQCEEIAKILAWCSSIHAIPLVAVPDSRPTRRGIAYHRLGVPGFAVPGGELWSSAPGKVCPGPRRIAQIPRVIARAFALRGGSPTTPLPPVQATRRRENVIQTYELAPGQGGRRWIFPVGPNVVVTERAWVSFAVNGPRSGKVRCFFQGAAGQGISDTDGMTEIKFGNGASAVKTWELPAGTAQVVVQWDMPEGGVMTYEGLARA